MLFRSLCGGEIIGGCNRGTHLGFNSFGVSGGPHGVEYHLHPDCARVLIGRLDKMMKLKREPEDAGEVEK